MATKADLTKDKSDAYMRDLSIILVALGKQLDCIDDVEFEGMDKFTLMGLRMSIYTQMDRVNDKLQEWGMIKL